MEFSSLVEMEIFSPHHFYITLSWFTSPTSWYQTGRTHLLNWMKKNSTWNKHLYLSFHNCFWFGGSQSSAQKERQQNILSLCRGSTPSVWRRVTLHLHLVLVTQTVDPWRGRLKASLRCISLGLAECCAVLSACSLVIDLMSFFRQFPVNTSATSQLTD